MKKAKQMERHLKGVANHNRIKILLLLYKKEGLTLDEIAEKIGGNIKNISQHTRRLKQAGLINKTYIGRTVSHNLSPYGEEFAHFIRSFSSKTRKN